MLRTRVNEVLGIEHPVLLAPMGRWAEASLALAVSEAGGLGSFGAWASMGIDEEYVRGAIAQIRAGTDKPFAAGFATHHIPLSRPQLNAVLEEEVPVVMLSFADPTPWIPMIHDAGSTVVCQVQSFDAARQAVDAGSDVICVQGASAGGHTGNESLLPLLIQVVETFPDVPVVASGGVTSGRSLAAVLAAGAEGAWMGTAFLVASEALFTEPPGLVEAILASDGRDTIRSGAIDVLFNAWGSDRPPWPDGIAMRSRTNPFVEEWHGREAILAADRERVAGYVERLSEPDFFPMLYGEGAGAVTTSQPASAILSGLINDAVTQLNRF